MKKIIYLLIFNAVCGWLSAQQTFTKTTDRSHSSFWQKGTDIVTNDDTKSTFDLVVKNSTKNAHSRSAISYQNLDSIIASFPLVSDKTSSYFLVWDKLKAIHKAVRSERQDGVEDWRQQRITKAQLEARRRDINEDRRVLQSKLYDFWVESRAFRFLPARSDVFAKCFYDANPDQVIGALKNSNLAFNDSSGYIYTEFFSGFMGPVRYSIGGLFSRNRLPGFNPDTTGGKTYTAQQIQDSMGTLNRKLACAQSLLNGGGNIMLINNIPVMDVSDNRQLVKFTLYAGNKLTLNIPGMASGITRVSVMDEYSAELFFNWNMTNHGSSDVLQNNLSFYLHAKIGGYACMNQFIQDAGLNVKNNSLAVFTVDGGLTIAQNVRVFGKYSITSSSQLNTGNVLWSAGMVVTPTKL